MDIILSFIPKENQGEALRLCSVVWSVCYVFLCFEAHSLFHHHWLPSFRYIYTPYSIQVHNNAQSFDCKADLLFWTLDVSRKVIYEITLVCLSVCPSVRLSVRPSVTKFPQDWIISFF